MHTGRDTLDDDLFRYGLTPLIPYANDLTYVGEAALPRPVRVAIGGILGSLSIVLKYLTSWKETVKMLNTYIWCNG